MNLNCRQTCWSMLQIHAIWILYWIGEKLVKWTDGVCQTLCFMSQTTYPDAEINGLTVNSLWRRWRSKIISRFGSGWMARPNLVSAGYKMYRFNRRKTKEQDFMFRGTLLSSPGLQECWWSYVMVSVTGGGIFRYCKHVGSWTERSHFANRHTLMQF
jgi:hypothetical protein